MERRHLLVHGLGWPRLSQLFHQLHRLEQLYRKCSPGLV